MAIVNLHKCGEIVGRFALRRAGFRNENYRDNVVSTGLHWVCLFIGRKYVIVAEDSDWTDRNGVRRGITHEILGVEDLGRIERIFGEAAAEAAAKVLGVTVIDDAP